MTAVETMFSVAPWYSLQRSQRRVSFSTAVVCLAFVCFALTGCSGRGVGGARPSADGPPLSAGSATLPPDAVPRVEPKSRGGNPSSYVVFGKRYYVLDSADRYVERGVASWYGRKFHGRRTSNGEVYDMHAMTAAHKSLPLPTFVEVTNLKNNRRVVLRVNDRGPFHDNRIIDLSYSAALKLDIVRTGTGLVEVRALNPADPDRSAPTTRQSQRTVAARSSPPLRPSRVVRSGNPSTGTGETSTNRLPPQQAVAPAVASAASVSSQQPKLYLQVGAFSDAGNAQRLRARLMSMQPATVNVVATTVNQQTVHRVRLGPLADVSSADRASDDIVKAGMELPRIVIE